MHCCENEKKESSEEQKTPEQKQEASGLKDYLILGLVAALVLFAVFEAVQINAIKQNAVTTQPAQSSGGETYEQMMARMHPEQAAAKTSGSGMVGGC